eukprot:6396342-Prymnesium_polylepis.1
MDWSADNHVDIDPRARAGASMWTSNPHKHVCVCVLRVYGAACVCVTGQRGEARGRKRVGDPRAGPLSRGNARCRSPARGRGH